jgi:TolB-like protein/DNA-binding winged helix-turn-helix (wHTH) protein
MQTPHFRFGLFEFDARSHHLRREGRTISLQTQPAKALACLLENAGNVVSREELRDAVWSAGTHVDFERGLNFCLSQIRTALNDDADRPLYIRTILKSGYQFIAPVEQVSEAALPGPPPAREISRPLTTRIAALAIAFSALFVATYLAKRSRSVHAGDPPPILAVVRFDNETSDPALTRFCDGLTDNVIVQLASHGAEQYRVIGNAAMLRFPRDQRDLASIRSSLHASYIVLGQVQTSGSQVRVLAHLIRTSDQTHLWVVRQDRRFEDQFALESQISQEIAAQFAPRLQRDVADGASSPTTNR